MPFWAGVLGIHARPAARLGVGVIPGVPEAAVPGRVEAGEAAEGDGAANVGVKVAVLGMGVKGMVVTVGGTLAVAMAAW